jgi:hypothetical protein
MSSQRTTSNSNSSSSSASSPSHKTSTSQEPRKLTIEEASQYRFYERVSKGSATLLQHGYSVRRATHIVRLEIAKVGKGAAAAGRKRADLDSPFEEEDEVRYTLYIYK